MCFVSPRFLSQVLYPTEKERLCLHDGTVPRGDDTMTAYVKRHVSAFIFYMNMLACRLNAALLVMKACIKWNFHNFLWRFYPPNCFEIDSTTCRRVCYSNCFYRQFVDLVSTDVLIRAESDCWHIFYSVVPVSISTFQTFENHQYDDLLMRIASSLGPFLS